MKTITMKKAVLAAILGLVALQAQADDIKVKYKVGDGLTIGDDDNQVHIQGRFQGRLTHSMLGAATPDTTSFSVPRAEIRIDGFTLEKKLKFGFEMNLNTRAGNTTTTVCASTGAATGICPGGTTTVLTAASTSGLATLNDYYADWVPYSYFGIQVGQFKVPFLIQQLTSSTKQQFVDRSMATGLFDLGRDLGVNLHGSVFDKKLGYAVAVMNGDGANTLNRNLRALLVATRLDWSILGEYKTLESDADYSQTPQLGVGVAYAFNERASAMQRGTIAAGIKAHNLTADTGIKYKGFSWQAAGMLSRSVEGASVTNYGFNTQAGYTLIPKRLEVAGKFGAAVLNGATANEYEYAGGVNYFIKGHPIKLQADFTHLRNSGGTAAKNDNIVRAAMNIIF